jgi:hypothetical protein
VGHELLEGELLQRGSNGNDRLYLTDAYLTHEEALPTHPIENPILDELGETFTNGEPAYTELLGYVRVVDPFSRFPPAVYDLLLEECGDIIRLACSGSLRVQ